MLQAVVVGSSNGWLYFLDVSTGRKLAGVDTGGAIKSGAVVDPWQQRGLGCLWLASYGKQLLACASTGGHTLFPSCTESQSRGHKIVPAVHM